MFGPGPTGEIELAASGVELLAASDVLPFPIQDTINASEAERLKNRFLDLRRPNVHANIVLRSKVISYIRAKMHDLGFLEFQRSTLDLLKGESIMAITVSALRRRELRGK